MQDGKTVCELSERIERLNERCLNLSDSILNIIELIEILEHSRKGDQNECVSK